MEIPLLKDLIIIFGLSVAVILVCHRLRIPTIVGFLLTGLLCGPHGLGLVSATSEVRALAEMGIVVLLFTVGLDFSIRRILEYKRYFFVGGAIQVALTSIVGFCIAQFLARPVGESIFLGFLLSLSSTAIVLRVIQERAESSSPHGRCILGILIFQDVIVVPMILLTPTLAGRESELDISLFYLIGEGILILLITYFAAVRIVPQLLYYVARTRSRELFLLSIIVIALTVAWISAYVGLSVALGAFLAGLIISESQYSRQAIGGMLPFEDVFLSFFFVSVGMLLDIGFVYEHLLFIVFVTIGILCLKSFTGSLAAVFMGVPIRSAVLAGLSLSQVGEFSFVLVKSGMTYGIGTDYHHQLFLSVAVITMAMTPTMIALSRRIAQAVLRLPLPMQLKTGIKPSKVTREPELKDHVIIVGYGLSGKNLARSSKDANVPYVIIDMDPDIVLRTRREGEPIFFGDATHERVLRHVNIETARAIAVVVNDPLAALRIVDQARRLNSDIYLIVRVRQLNEMKPLYDLGADDVIPDEFGSSVEIFTHVLLKYDVPSEKIAQLVNDLRREGYEMLRLPYTEMVIYPEIKEHLADVEVRAIRIRKNSPLIGKTLKETELRKIYGVTVLIIRRKGLTIHDLTPDTKLLQDDILVVVGTEKNLSRVAILFHPE